MSSRGIWEDRKLRYKVLDKKWLLSLHHWLCHDLREWENYFFLNSDTGTQRYKGNESLCWESEVLRIQIWWIEMKKTSSTNISSTFCHRMAYNFAQDPFFNKCQGEKCVLWDVTFTGRKAGKKRKVTTQALLSLVVWSEWMIRYNSLELWSGDQNNRDDL